MTNRERLNQMVGSMTDKELASKLCDVMDIIAEKANIDTCDICPVTDLCKRGQSGFLAWLGKEAEG